MNSNSYEKFIVTSIFSLIGKNIKVPLFLENFNAIILEMNVKNEYWNERKYFGKLLSREYI